MIETFQKQLETRFLQQKEDKRLDLWKQKSWDRFLLLGLPHAKTEDFRYLPMKQLYTLNFQEQNSSDLSWDIKQWIHPGYEDFCLVFVDGKFSQKLSTLQQLQGIVVQSFHQSFQSFGTFQQNHLENFIKKEKDPFALLNLALHPKGGFFYIPEKVQKVLKIQILSIQTHAAMTPVRIQGFFGKNTHTELIHTSVNICDSHIWNHIDFDFILDEKAKVQFCSIPQSHPKEWYFSSFRAELKTKADLHAFFAPTHLKIFRQKCHITLQGKQSKAVLSGVWNSKKQNQVHWNTYMEHVAEECISSQQFKGVLHEESRSSFDGKIYVHPQAQKTDSYQSNRNLILSPKAKAFVKPNLEIYADDVKASHGATISQISEDQLFYLKSRGLSLHQAKTLLVEGFYQEILQTCPIPSLFKNLTQWIQ